MGDLNSEITELDWLNLFCSAILGKPNVQDNISCFRNLNYKPFFFNKFNITIEEEDTEKLKEVTPDIILWNKELELVIIIEVKGENSVKRKNLLQLNKYKEISIQEVQTRLRNATDNPLITVKNIYTGIVYRKETISKCYLSDDCRNLLEEIMKNHLAFTQNHGEKLEILNNNIISFDDLLRNALNNGFDLPLNPLIVFYLTKNPCKKGIIWGIVNHIHDKFYNNEIIDEIRINPILLRRDVFFYSDVKLNKILEALENLSHLRICNRVDREYIFEFDKMQDFDKIKEIIDRIDCKQQKPFQKDLINYLREKEPR